MKTVKAYRVNTELTNLESFKIYFKIKGAKLKTTFEQVGDIKIQLFDLSFDY